MISFLEYLKTNSSSWDVPDTTRVLFLHRSVHGETICWVRGNCGSVPTDVVALWWTDVLSRSTVEDLGRCECLDSMFTRMFLGDGMHWVHVQLSHAEVQHPFWTHGDLEWLVGRSMREFPGEKILIKTIHTFWNDVFQVYKVTRGTVIASGFWYILKQITSTSESLL